MGPRHGQLNVWPDPLQIGVVHVGKVPHILAGRVAGHYASLVEGEADMRKNTRSGWVRQAGVGIVALLSVILSGKPSVSFSAEPVGTEAALTGYWLSQDHDGVFKIDRCGQNLCGHLIGLRYDGTDVPHGHDGKSECDLLMLTDFQPMEGSNKGRWAGHILDPDTGHLYDSQIWTTQPDVLKLRGYIGLPIFGETQTWTRYKGPAMGPVCKIPDSVK